MTTDKPALYIPALGGIYSSLEGCAHPLLRIYLGLLFMPHGAQKLFGMFGGGGISGTGTFLEGAGYSPGTFWAVVIGVLEVFGGLGLVLGLFTRPIAAAFVIFMAVAAFSFHLPNGFFWTGGGYEMPMTLLIMALILVIKGAGTYSLDSKMAKEF